MSKIIIPLLMIMTISLSGCIFDPFYGDHGGRGWDHHGRDGWGHRGGRDYDGGGHRGD